MLFNSLEFAFFFPLVVGLYFVLAANWRTPLLLGASCLFYMAFIPSYILILLITILIDYWAGIYLERLTGRIRKWLLVGSITATCAVLFVFKYSAFFTESFVGLTHLFGWEVSSPALNIILPIGLSFHTFQSLSYVVEVYYRRQRAEYDFTTYATYVMFFPQLVAGPIERPQNLLHQFREYHWFEYERVTSGLRRIAWGFFKKLVIADRLAIYVNDVYGAPQQHNGLQLTLATIFFAYQIYCDFSGYSDIAIGTARVLGFKLMENFDRPYSSASITEFWRRWHISLSTWFRDYLYVPLGGSRVNRVKGCRNLLLTFVISGLWHGAAWTYVVWGALNGFYLVAERLTAPARKNLWLLLGLAEATWLHRLVGVLCTFFLTCLGWVFFRANDLSEAAYILSHFWKGWDLGAIRTENFLLRQMPVAILSIVFLELVQWLNPKIPLTGVLAVRPLILRWSVYASFVVGVILFGIYRKGQFIYFQF